MEEEPPTKAARAAEFYRHLQAAPVASNFAEAYDQVCELLNQVEDEFTSIPFDPSRWKTDGRMYPPQRDRMSVDPLRQNVFVFESRRHRTRIGINGAIEIIDSRDQIVFAKIGSDGQPL